MAYVFIQPVFDQLKVLEIGNRIGKMLLRVVIAMILIISPATSINDPIMKKIVQWGILPIWVDPMIKESQYPNEILSIIIHILDLSPDFVILLFFRFFNPMKSSKNPYRMVKAKISLSFISMIVSD